MAKVTGFTAERMLAIENSCIVGGAVDLEGRLKLTRRDGETVDGGSIYPSKQVVINMVAADIIKQIHAIGDVVITTKNTSPASRYGGTWVLTGTGRTLVGVDSADADFNAPKKTGGAKTHTLTVAEMPTHTHTQSPHTHTSAAHTHTSAAHTHTSAAHTHTSSAHTHSSIPTQADTSIFYKSANDSTWWNHRRAGGSYTPTHGFPMNWTPQATMAIAPTYATGLSGSGNTASTTPGATGSTTPGDTGSTTPGDTGATATTINNTTAVNASTGSGAAHNNLPPYLTVYFWEKTA